MAMYSQKYLLLPFFFLTVHTIRIEQRMVGGHDCEITEHPYYVALYDSDGQKQICSGSLLNLSYVLTAAHCCIMENQTFVVRAGQSTREPEYEQERHTENIYIHWDFNQETLNYDVCLLKMEEPFTKTLRTQPVKLASEEEIIDIVTKGCPNGTVMGFGIHPENVSGDTYLIYQANSEMLQCADIEVIPAHVCNYVFDQYMLCNVVCTRIYADERTRYGDTGGPLMCGDLQIGVSSFTPEPVYDEQYGMFATLDHNFRTFLVGSGQRRNLGSSIFYTLFGLLLVIVNYSNLRLFV